MSPAPSQLDSPRGRRLLALLRKVCAPLPEVSEGIDGFGHTTFKVRRKSFIIAGMGEDGVSVAFKADLPSQGLLVRREGFFRTPYIGHHGWVSCDPLTLDEAEVEALAEDGWRRAAPRRLAARFQGS